MHTKVDTTVYYLMTYCPSWKGDLGWTGRRVEKLARTVGGRGGLEKCDDRGKLQRHHDELETVDVHVSWVFVVGVKSVTHVVRPHDIKPETKGVRNRHRQRPDSRRRDGGWRAGNKMTDRN
jgi:hypothetical protein